MILLVVSIEEVAGGMTVSAQGHGVEDSATEREQKELGRLAQLIARHAEAAIRTHGKGNMVVNDPNKLINPE